MPRRRFSTIILLTAAVLACGALAYFAANRRTPEPSFQGHSARYWLRVFGVTGLQDQAMEAFRQMGTNADPVLVAAVAGKESNFDKIFRRVYPKLPAAMQRRLTQPDDLLSLRSAAQCVVMNSSSRHIVPKLVSLLEDTDSGVRVAVLRAVQNRIGPKDADLIPPLLLAGNDPDARVRAGALACLTEIKSSAASAMPAVLKLCADKDIGVRMGAAWALWNITGQTNTAVPILEGILGESQDAHGRHWAACYLLEMGQSDPLLIPTFISSLTNRQTGVRMSACACLGQIGHPASAAVPALLTALQDADGEVRRRAKIALTTIDPEHTTSDP
jgi:HEAT repeat protein